MLKLFSKYWSFIFIFAVWFAFASPYFLKGLVPYPSTYQVNHFPPWSYFEKYPHIVKNGAMPDIISQIYPWKHLVIEEWKKGQIALWNPYSFSGNPHLANFQSAVFTPLNILYFVLPFIDAWSIAIILQPLLLGFSMYLFLKKIKASDTASTVGSVIWMFSGFCVVWMGYGTLVYAIGLLPLALYSIESFYDTSHIKYLFMLSFLIAFSFFSGHFQTSFYFLFFTFLFSLFKVFVNAKEKMLHVKLFLFIMFGVLLTMPQLLPSIEFYQNSVRSSIFNKTGGIPLSYLVTLFSPDFYGNPVTANDWVGNYAEWAGFVGVIPLFLSLFSLKKKSKVSIFFAIAAFATLVLAIESPLQPLIGMLKIPVISTSNPTRIIVLFSFSISVLAAFGFDNLLALLASKKTKKIFIPFFILATLFLFVWLLIFVVKPMSLEHLLVAKRNLIFPTFLLISLFCMIVLSLKFKKILLLTAYFVLFAVSFDSFRFAQKWMPFDPKNIVFADEKITEVIKMHAGNNRIFGNLGTEFFGYYDLQSLEGYDPLYIGSYGELLRSAADGSFTEAERSVAKISRIGMYTDRVLNLLGTELIFHPIADTNQSWAYHTWSKDKNLSILYQDDHFQLFKNNDALPRVFLFNNYIVVNDRKKIISEFFKPDFDYKKTLILEEEPELSIKKDIINSQNNAKIIEYSPNKITIQTQSNNSSLLFLADNYYPGWKAYIDAIPTKILRTDYSFRSIVVQKGKHEVVFEYEPLSLQIGFILSGIGIILLIMCLVFNSKIEK